MTIPATTVMEEGTNHEKHMGVVKITSEEIDSFLMEGTTKLKVQRFASGVDTRYHVVPA